MPPRRSCISSYRLHGGGQGTGHHLNHLMEGKQRHPLISAYWPVGTSIVTGVFLSSTSLGRSVCVCVCNMGQNYNTRARKTNYLWLWPPAVEVHSLESWSPCSSLLSPQASSGGLMLVAIVILPATLLQVRASVPQRGQHSRDASPIRLLRCLRD